MTKTKRALLMSVLSLIMCISMLIGTTFAWFTDSVTSANNIIKSGSLDIELYWAEGDEDPVGVAWKDASKGAIFNYDLWEPGYVEAKHIKIVNEGTLAFKYMLHIVPNGAVDILADVIDVYYIEGAKQLTRADLAGATPVGTLRDMINEADGAAHGALLPAGKTATNAYERVGEVTATIAFKMRESAGNEYMNKSIGTDFSIRLLATQYTFEEDSFDNQYDKDAKYPLVDTVDIELDNATIESGETATLKVTVLPEDAINNTVIWTSSNESVATVDKNGVVTGIAPGTATIYASAGEFSDSCTVTVFKDYVKKLNRGHTQTSYLSTSTGADFLPIVAVMPEITGYSVYDGDTRITDEVHFCFTRVEKQTIDEDSYKVLVDLAIKDANGNDLELKEGMPSTINGKEYLHVYMNLIEVPAGYSISEVKVNGSSFTLTNNASGTLDEGEYWIGYEAKDVYFQSKEAGLIEVTVTKMN